MGTMNKSTSSCASSSWPQSAVSRKNRWTTSKQKTQSKRRKKRNPPLRRNRTNVTSTPMDIQECIPCIQHQHTTTLQPF
ncbi:uncharacterized protein LOC111058994 [Nilaparvata lugens]|uniref:uncharacterized protein LOC111058994 n=1 Tax=Nilaparvata lugens TaxID=108931 RepID=UPI00193EA1B3|nr:uncharacterized protein LOC111058994 [Nilaparvata lugens]